MKKLFVIFLLALIGITSCKKDPFPQPTSNSVRTNTNTANTTNTTTATNTTTPSYNITYNLWSPYQTISVSYGVPATQTLSISLDSNNAHNIRLYLNEQYAGTFGGGMPSPQYSSYAEILRIGADSSVFFASHKANNTCILTNDWINDSLKWTTWLDLRDVDGFGGYSPPVNMGDWDHVVSNGFVAIKIVTSQGNKYGWIKLDVPDCYHMTMQAQALNNNYGQFIQAGQTH